MSTVSPAPDPAAAVDARAVRAVVQYLADAHGVEVDPAALDATTRRLGRGPSTPALVQLLAAEVGLITAVVRRPLKEVLADADPAYPWLALRTGANGQPEAIAVLTAARGGALVAVPGMQTRPARWATASVLEWLGVTDPNVPVEWIMAEPAAPLSAMRSRDGGPPLHPYARLRALLEGERRTLWVAVIYSVVIALLALVVPIAVQSLVNTIAFGSVLQPLVVLTLFVFVALGFSTVMNALRAGGRRSHPAQHLRPGGHRRDVATPAGAGQCLRPLPRSGTGQPLLRHGHHSEVGGAAAHRRPQHPDADGHRHAAAGPVPPVAAGLRRAAGRGHGGHHLRPRSRRPGHQHQRVEGRSTPWSRGSSSWPRNLVTFKSAGGAEYAMERSHRLLEEYLSYRAKHFRILIRQIVGSFALQAVASSALLGIGGWLVISRQLTLGQLVASELIVAGMLSAFTKFGKQLEVFYDLCAAIDKLGVLVDLPLERTGGVVESPTRGPIELTLRDLRVHYEDSRTSRAGGPVVGHPGGCPGRCHRAQRRRQEHARRRAVRPA